MWSVSVGYNLVATVKPSGQYLSFVVGRQAHCFRRLHQLQMLFSVQ
jgi:hypothetical protein